tara:strand:- start:6859 stop:6987 length:129 start_codon:yes stop_codon:yes gene_type:complete
MGGWAVAQMRNEFIDTVESKHKSIKPYPGRDNYPVTTEKKRI